MAYSKHVLLYGLDELRAHQRGEQVGKPIASKPDPIPSLTRKRSIYRTMDDITEEEKQEILTSEENARVIAARMGIHTNRVYSIRRANDPTPVKPRNPQTNLSVMQRVEIACAVGSITEVAKRFQVSESTVKRCRGLYRGERELK
jgi:hypothetical protein